MKQRSPWLVATLIASWMWPLVGHAADAPQHAVRHAAAAEHSVHGQSVQSAEATDAGPGGVPEARASVASSGATPSTYRLPPHPVPLVLSLVPGVLVHGAGQLGAGEKRTGLRLLALEGAGAGVAVGSLMGVALTGASRRVVAPLVATTVLGVGLFAGTMLVDVYAAAVPMSWRGRAPRTLPHLVLEGGAAYRYDPGFEGRLLLSHALDARLGEKDRHRLRVELQTLPDEPASRSRALYSYRFWAPRRDGSFLELEGAALHQRHPHLGFFSTTGEVAVRGRLDLERIGPRLRGAFAEGRFGASMSALRSRDVDTDADSAVMARIGVGAYLGRGQGEVELYYDHRRDTFAGGMLLPGIPAGYAGFVGLRAERYFGEHLGVRLDAQAGSAGILGASLLFRHGGKP